MRLFWSMFCMLLVFVFFVVPVFAFSHFRSHSLGYDISFPQCGSVYPSKPYSFVIVGVTGGKAFTRNPCLSDEFFWAKRMRSETQVYMNLNSPSGSTVWLEKSRSTRLCVVRDLSCKAYTYGYTAAENAYQYALSQFVSSHVWWLDIELANTWYDNTTLNRDVIDGAVDFFESVSVVVGVYSIQSDWNTIVGSDFSPTQRILSPLPNWVVGDGDPKTAAFYCLFPFASNGWVWVVQNTPGDFDEDYQCP